MNVQFRESTMNHILNDVNKLPDITATKYYTERNQANNLEYHVIIKQESDDSDTIGIKHYCYIDDGYDNFVPCKEALEYNHYTIYKAEQDFLRGLI